MLGQRNSVYPEALCTHGFSSLAERRTQLCLSFARKQPMSGASDRLPLLQGGAHIWSDKGLKQSD